MLASAVIWTHSYWRVVGVSEVDELTPWLGTPISAYAVDGFFFLSGFLVYRSLALRSSVGDFVLARLARLWPALAVAVLLMVSGGFLIAGLPPGDYLRGATTDFVISNLSLLKGSYTLTGVMCDGVPCNVNGSLWTISWEVRCYALLALLGLTGLASPRWMARVVLPLSALGALGLHVPGVSTLLRELLGDGIFYNIIKVDRLWTMFALGIAAYIWRGRIRLSWLILTGLLALNLLAQWRDVHIHIQSLFVGYAVLCAGFLTAPDRAVSGRWPDYSYGMYIYAFPVMMLLGAVIPLAHHGWLALANFLATLPFAALSWHYVEQPVLERVRERRMRKKAAISANL